MSQVPTDIDTKLNLHISHLCSFSLGSNNSQNHCAHFVSHVMGYEFLGPTCKNFTWDDKQKTGAGATIRVDDIFKRSQLTGLLKDNSVAMTECLIFVTLASNIRITNGALLMGNHPRKHIGILSHGKVWNYSNTANKVVAENLEAFTTKFTNAYKTTGTTVEFYFGKFI